MAFLLKNEFIGTVLVLGILCDVHSLKTSVVKCPSPCTCNNEEDGGLVLNCRRKGLTSLPDLSQVKNETIFRLLLDSNRITNLEDNAFQELNIKGLDLAFNPLTALTPASISGLEESLTFLSLSGTKLSSWPKDALGSLTKLQNLDIAGIFAGNPADLPIDMFAGLSRMQTLFLSNNGLSSLPSDVFEEMASLEVLILNENKLTTIPDAVRNLPNLVELSLISNKISAATKDSLLGLSRLRYLKLSDNMFKNVSSLPKESFDSVRSSLESLDLDFNDLDGVPDFGEMGALQRLNLAGTMITKIMAGAFAGLTSLRILDISDNSLEITKGMFDGLENTLQVLKMNRVDIESIPSAELENLGELQELQLSGNNIASLGDLSKTSVFSYDFEYNQISYISDSSLEAIESPLILKLSHNQLKNLTFISDVCKFSRLELNGNDVHCDCGVYDLVRSSGPEVYGRCATPANFKRLSLRSVEFMDMMEPVCNDTLGAAKTCSFSSGANVFSPSCFLATLLSLVVIFNSLISVNYVDNQAMNYIV